MNANEERLFSLNNMAASTNVIEMRAAIEQVLAELESIPSLKDEQKGGTGGFFLRKRCFCKDPVQSCCLLDELASTLLSRHTPSLI